MADPDELDVALSEGIITPEQAAAIRARRAAAPAATPPESAAGDEPFRLVSNFGDVFLCLGLLILYWSMNAFLRVAGVPDAAVFGGFAVLFWLLAEFFVFRTRRKFPAVVSAFLFAWAAFKGLGAELGDSSMATLLTGSAPTWSYAALTGLFGIALLRFRLPVMVLALAVSVTLLIFSLVIKAGIGWNPALLIFSACGLAFLAVGIWLDSRDKARTGIFHEWALWLFVVGSPLTVHPLFLYLIGDRVKSLSSLDLTQIDLSAIVIWVVLLAIAFTVAGLLLDRRSLVASPLLYLSAALGYVGLQAGAGVLWIAALVPLLIGLYVILMGVAWNGLRRALLRIVPFRSLFRPADL